MSFSNKLSRAETERLAILAEELGEAIHGIGKILRHGYRSTHPDGGPENRELLEQELGDIQFAVSLLTGKGDLDEERIAIWKESKAERIHEYLHHQTQGSD